MKRGTLDDELEALRAIRDQTDAPEARDRLRRALGSKRSFLVSAAAEIVAAAELSELLPLLLPAFDRFMEDPVKNDKGCRAKIAIADALQRAAYDAPDLYLRGLRHVQEEPVWGGHVDTAAPLRGLCGFGLARIDHPDAMAELAGLLADPERAARADAARALLAMGSPEAIPVLRLKALVGDADPQVMTECFGALLGLSPRSLPFVARFLHHKDEAVSEAAALALGESKREGALDVLRPFCEGLPPDSRRTALLAIALVRSSAALDYLVSVVERGPSGVAAHALGALGLYRHDAPLRSRVEAIVAARASRPLRQAFAEAFPPV
jgi:HEAT repeat protein